MKVLAGEQRVMFEWGGEGSDTVLVQFLGSTHQNKERLDLLHQAIRGLRHEPIVWVELMRRSTWRTDGWSGKVDPLRNDALLSWKGQFADWQTAGAVFALLCKAVGIDDDAVALEISW